jgi:hypothetical protein
MGQSVLVFISHSSDDKEALVEPLVRDLETCYIGVWLDKRRIIPGENLRQSIFREGLDKADVALVFFTKNALSSAWVDREIKHVLREETRKGNSFNLRKVICVFDSDETYSIIAERYPELTDDLLHLMPLGYSMIQFGQLLSAIWSKYLALQGGDVATQRLLLEKDRELFRREQELQEVKRQLQELKTKRTATDPEGDFKVAFESGALKEFVAQRERILSSPIIARAEYLASPRAFGFVEPHKSRLDMLVLTEKGREFFKWLLLKKLG